MNPVSCMDTPSVSSARWLSIVCDVTRYCKWILRWVNCVIAFLSFFLSLSLSLFISLSFSLFISLSLSFSPSLSLSLALSLSLSLFLSFSLSLSHPPLVSSSSHSLFLKKKVIIITSMNVQSRQTYYNMALPQLGHLLYDTCYEKTLEHCKSYQVRIDKTLSGIDGYLSLPYLQTFIIQLGVSDVFLRVYGNSQSAASQCCVK